LAISGDTTDEQLGAGLRAAVRGLSFNVWPYLTSAGMVAIATGVSYLIEPIIAPSNLSLVYLTAVLFSALRYGLWPSITAAMLGVLVWNYLFLPPKFSMAIDDPQDVLALLLFLIVSLVVSNLAALKLRQSEAIAARAKTTTQLYLFSQKIAAAGSLSDLLPIITQTIGTMLNCEALLLFPAGDGLQLSAGHPQKRELDIVELSLAQAAMNGTPGSLAGRLLFMPLRSQRGVIGVLGVDRSLSQLLLPDEERLLSIFVDQAAVAIERTQLAETIDQARLEAETERLRSAMLTSISHDLRTPLTTIMAAHSMLRKQGEAGDPSIRRELFEQAENEAERLDRFIGNLIDMTQLESGKMKVNLGPIEVGDALESALARASHLIIRHSTEIDLPLDLPMVTADFMLLEQVLFNLIDNAVKYAPQDTIVSISASTGDGTVVIGVADQGDGIPSDATEIIFDKFARVRFEDRQRPGTGLGLAICRGFLQAMGGTIFASNRKDQPGALFVIELAISKP
jgi:two-component system, OmpR family, sensor histidine kinase KdpD